METVVYQHALVEISLDFNSLHYTCGDSLLNTYSVICLITIPDISSLTTPHFWLLTVHGSYGVVNFFSNCVGCLKT